MSVSVSNEKKWFVYLGDHHEGPFSTNELELKLNANELNSNSYVWSEGMKDWVFFKDNPELKPILASQAPDAFLPELQLERFPSSGLVAALPSAKEFSAPLPQPALQKLAIDDTPFREVKKRHEESLRHQWLKKIKYALFRFLRLLKMALKWAVVGGFVYAGYQGWLNPILEIPVVREYFQKSQEIGMPIVVQVALKNSPSSLRWISKIPDIENIDAADLTALRVASLSTPSAIDPATAIAVTSGGLKPMVYIGSGLPDGARFEIQITGVPETLVDRLSATNFVSARVESHLARAEASLPNGSPLPSGVYHFYVVESPEQPENVKALLNPLPISHAKDAELAVKQGAKIFASKTVTVGLLRGNEYQKALAKFHAQIRVQAECELQEIRKASAQMEEILDVSTKNLKGLSGHKGGVQAKVWRAFQTQWAPVILELSNSVEKWTSEEFKNKAYYQNLYLLAVQAGQGLLSYNSIQKRLIQSKVDPQSLEIQLGEALSVAQSTIWALKAKTDAAERIAGSGDLPQKDGL